MKTINFYDYLDMIDCSLEVHRYANQNERWTAQIENCEVKEGVILMGVYGNADSPTKAISDYVKKIRGKRIVINAGSPEHRREFNMSEYIFYLGEK